MTSDHNPFDAVDALLAAVESGAVLPAPAERIRLREAAGLTEAAIAQALGVRPPSVAAWEAGRSEPKGEKLEAYRRLLEGLARKFPAADQPSPPAQAPSAATVAEASPTPAKAEVQAPKKTAAASKPTSPAAPASAAEARFANGPLLVLDGDGLAYGVGGLLLDCPATTVPDLVEWTLAEARIGSERLHPSGKDGDPLVVLTAAAAERLGLPGRLADRRGLRLPENHPVLGQLAKGGWKLSRRGFGPWARIYRPAQGRTRFCVQLAVLPWDALDTRTWGEDADQLPAPALAQLLGDYATRVITPIGSAAVCGIELMTALRPPTHAVDGRPAARPTSLPVPVDPAPPEPPDDHPLATGRPDGPEGALDEESFAWVRDPELLSDAECALPFAVGIDTNTAYLAASSRLRVGLGEAVHVNRPAFDKKLPGSWLIDLSEIRLDPRLPSPFTPTGRPPTGPAWYATPTVAYAFELARMLGQHVDLHPEQAWLRPDEAQLRDLVAAYGITVPPAPWDSGDTAALQRLGLEGALAEDETTRRRALDFLATVPRFAAGPYLDPWYDRLRDAYLATMARLGVTPDLTPAQFLAAMEHHKQTDPVQAAVLAAIKGTVKSGVGKLRERPQSAKHRPGQPWPALRRTTWRPDIRAAVIATCRANLHRKIMAMALKADRYPIAINVDCVVYPSPGPSPLDVLPYDGDGKPLPGGFRLGVSPGMVKHEGTREFIWAAQLMDDQLNPARVIKGTDAVLDGE